MKTLLIITAAVAIHSVSLAENPPPASLWNSAQQAKAADKYDDYLALRRKAIDTSLSALSRGEVDAATVAGWIADYFAIPKVGKDLCGDSYDSMILSRCKVLKDIARTTWKRGGVSDADFAVTRRKLSDAIVQFIKDVHTISLPEELKLAREEVENASKDYLKLPLELRSDPEIWSDRAARSSYANVKNPVTRAALERIPRAEIILSNLKIAQPLAAKELPATAKLAGTFLCSLYGQTPLTPLELPELLRAHEITDSSIVRAILED